jgi:tetratricopeptide (TPR) repeat protein
VIFGLVALWAYARYAARPGCLRYLGVMAAYALSLLCKPTLITLPFALLLLDYWPLRRMTTRGRLLLEKVPLLALAGAMALITTVARDLTWAAVPFTELPLSDRLANAVTAYGWYLAHTLWPGGLAILYPHPHHDWSVLAALGGTAALLTITALAVWHVRRRPWLLVGWLWFVGTLVPVIGLAQGGEQAWADRFTYWPHVGLFVALVWGLAELVERLRIPAAVAGFAAAVVLAGFGAATWVQVGYWHDTAALWERALAVTETNHQPHFDLGRYYLERGRLEEAEAHLATAASLHPHRAQYEYFLGVAQLCLGRADEAAGHLEEAWQLAPYSSEAWYALGLARLRQGQSEEAISCFQQALTRRPESTDALAGIGLGQWREGQQQEAVQSFRAVLERDPNWFEKGAASAADSRDPRPPFDLSAQLHEMLRGSADLVDALAAAECARTE